MTPLHSRFSCCHCSQISKEAARFGFNTISRSPDIKQEHRYVKYLFSIRLFQKVSAIIAQMQHSLTENSDLRESFLKNPKREHSWMIQIINALAAFLQRISEAYVEVSIQCMIFCINLIQIEVDSNGVDARNVPFWSWRAEAMSTPSISAVFSNFLISLFFNSESDCSKRSRLLFWRIK